MAIKRLFLDLETSPNIVYSWRVGYNIILHPENIIKERAVICAAYKWQGDSKVEAISWDKGDDKRVLQKLAQLVDEADEVVAHNGDAFDIKWLRTRCLLHGIALPPGIKTLDTKKFGKEGFYFNSNKLDYIAQLLGFGNKIKTEFQLWVDVLANKKKALQEMIRYNKHDVVLLEKVFEKLEPYMPHKTHAGVLDGGMKSDCPRCASINVQRRGQRVSAAGTITQRLSCNDCGRMFSVALTTVNRENKRRSKKI